MNAAKPTRKAHLGLMRARLKNRHGVYVRLYINCQVSTLQTLEEFVTCDV